ncbi:MAG: hypothetical protein R3C49_05175 [Planctomycetaceae bacterium]
MTSSNACGILHREWEGRHSLAQSHPDLTAKAIQEFIRRVNCDHDRR